jgi:hypothetical protein
MKFLNLLFVLAFVFSMTSCGGGAAKVEVKEEVKEVVKEEVKEEVKADTAKTESHGDHH